MSSSEILIIGAGIFGLPAALELRRRGHAVSVMDTGPIPHPLAASTDISKVIRMEYGSNELYMALMEEGLRRWRQWNEIWEEQDEAPLFHETGITMVCRGEMAPGGFEYESYCHLLKRDHKPQRLDGAAIADRFPAWNAEVYVDGFYHAMGGYADSGAVIEALARQAKREGVTFHVPFTMTELIEENGRVTGVKDQAGEVFVADAIVVATGAWTGTLLPELSNSLAPIGQPVFHLKPSNPNLFTSDHFPVFTADIARTGYYGFPLHPDGIVKIARHGIGTWTEPNGEREVTDRDHMDLRAFLARTFPSLLHDEVIHTRLCLYTDSPDGHFWIDRDPTREGLTVASGGSGHGFKFGPVFGSVIADTVEGRDGPWRDLFRWRPELDQGHDREAARYQG